MASPLHETADSVCPTVKQTGRNLVVCCDGTGNIWKPGPDKTNVAKLFEVLEKSNSQITYYDPGVGTRTALFPAMRVAVFLTARPCAASGVWLGATGFGRMSQRLIPSCSATTSMATVSSCSGSPGAHLPPVPFRGSSTCSACYGKGTRI